VGGLAAVVALGFDGVALAVLVMVEAKGLVEMGEVEDVVAAEKVAVRVGKVTLQLCCFSVSFFASATQMQHHTSRNFIPTMAKGKVNVFCQHKFIYNVHFLKKNKLQIIYWVVAQFAVLA
jgi:hypothetical protein